MKIDKRGGVVLSLIQAIILGGVFQGVAEFLPISSSGHLALLQHLFNIKEGNLFFLLKCYIWYTNINSNSVF